MQAKFCKQPILSQILGVLKSPTAEIVFLDFRQIEAVFGKTNYTTFSYLVMSSYRQNMNEIKILSLAAKFLILRDFNWHSLLILIYSLHVGKIAISPKQIVFVCFVSIYR